MNLLLYLHLYLPLKSQVSEGKEPPHESEEREGAHEEE